MSNLFDAETCDRCGDRLGIKTTSYLNTDTLCVRCKSDERGAPGYKAAVEAEFRAVESGDYNFPGRGLSRADQAYLAKRRLAR